MPCRRGRNGTPIKVFADRLGDQCGSVAAGDGDIEFLAELVVERDGDAHGHATDNIVSTDHAPYRDDAADTANGTIADSVGPVTTAFAASHA